MNRIALVLIVCFCNISSSHAQQFYIDMRAAVQNQDGSLQILDHFLEPILEDSFYLSTVRELPPPIGSFLIEAESEASLITGRLHIRNNCPDIAGACSSDASWEDNLTFDATSIPAGTFVPINISATVSGNFTTLTGYTIFVQSANPFVVVDTLRADVGYQSAVLTTTSDATAFTVFFSEGTWNTLGPATFQGQVLIEGGFVNNVQVLTVLNGNTEQDMTSTFSLNNSSGLSYTSASGAFLTDADGDGVSNSSDNCTFIPNADQRDSNGDGHGNVCDFDYTNDCNTNFSDLFAFSGAFGSSSGDANYDVDVDLTDDGVVNFLDLGVPPNNFSAFFGGPPGPSASACVPAP